MHRKGIELKLTVCSGRCAVGRTVSARRVSAVLQHFVFGSVANGISGIHGLSVHIGSWRA